MHDSSTPYGQSVQSDARMSAHGGSPIPIMALGASLSLFFALTFVICVLFDLWFPALAMNPVWAPLLPGFIWISWTSFFLGLIETIAYGWYVALIFGPLYNFFATQTQRRPR